MRSKDWEEAMRSEKKGLKKKGEWCIKKKGRVSVFCAGEWNIKKKKGWRYECVVFCEGCKELKKKCELKKKGGVSMFCAGERNIEKKKRWRSECAVFCAGCMELKKSVSRKKKKNVCAC